MKGGVSRFEDGGAADALLGMEDLSVKERINYKTTLFNSLLDQMSVVQNYLYNYYFQNEIGVW